MRAMVLAAGEGTRLAPYTTAFPKPLVPLGTRPILEILLAQLGRAGFDDVMISVGYLSGLIRAYFHEGRHIPKGMRITYIEEERPLGTAGALALVPDFREGLLVVNGDILTTLDYAKLVRVHNESDAHMTLAATIREIQIPLGVLEAEETKITGFREKPRVRYLAGMGANVYRPEVLEQFEAGTRIDVPDLATSLLRADKPVRCHRSNAYWLDLGTRDDYHRACRDWPRIRPLVAPDLESEEGNDPLDPWDDDHIWLPVNEI
ncbi:sugar phosphate nucleotidyltransferase [Planctomycetota bacterium]